MRVASKRVQMYFPQDLFRRLNEAARQEKLSVSAVVRKAVLSFLQRREEEKDWENDPIWDIIGAGESKDGDLSVNHDVYLYGKSTGNVT